VEAELVDLDHKAEVEPCIYPRGQEGGKFGRGRVGICGIGGIVGINFKISKRIEVRSGRFGTEIDGKLQLDIDSLCGAQ
jgi:hypothetical protein